MKDKELERMQNYIDTRIGFEIEKEITKDRELREHKFITVMGLVIMGLLGFAIGYILGVGI